MKHIEKLEARRNRKKLLFCLWEGLKQLFLNPWKNIFLVVLLAGYLFLFDRLPLEQIMPEILPELFTTVYFTLYSMIFLLLLIAVIVALGMPFGSSKVEENLSVVFSGNKDSLQILPFLISKRKVKGTDVTRWEFYSEWTPMADWKSKQAAIEDTLKCRFVETPQYGGKNRDNNHRIVLHTRSGANPKSRGRLYDEL